jgi:hypothetical protein
MEEARKRKKKMSLFSFGKQQSSSQEALSTAEAYLRQDCNDTHISALVRHYHVAETTDIIEQFTGVSLNDKETAQLVQTIRDEYSLGPIEDYNQPSRGGFWGLFG